MTAFFDSELALSAALTHFINHAPNIRQRINISRVVLEKTENAQAILNLMGDLDSSESGYIERAKHFGCFDWTERIDRKILLADHVSLQKDRRIAIHYYPIENWLDAVMMYVLQEKASHILTSELAKVFYQPLVSACHMVMTYDRVHASLGREELLRLTEEAVKNGKSDEILAAFDYWLPRARAIFDPKTFPYFEQLRALGLPHRSNEEMLADFDEAAQRLLQSLYIISEL